MESEEKSEESSYPSPVVPEITNIQKRLQKICGVDEEEAKVRDWFRKKYECIVFVYRRKISLP